MIIFLIAVAFIVWILYYLFIKGNAFLILFLIFGIIGGKHIIREWFPHSKNIIMTFMNYDISYATFMAVIISILAIGVIMEKANE